MMITWILHYNDFCHILHSILNNTGNFKHVAHCFTLQAQIYPSKSAAPSAAALGVLVALCHAAGAFVDVGGGAATAA